MINIDSRTKQKIINIFLKLSHVNLKGVYISKGSNIYAKMIIDSGSRINGPITVKGRGTLTVGKYCAFGDNVRIITSNHDTSYLNVQYALQKKISGRDFVAGKKNISIGNGVWIGDAATLLPGIEVGDGAVIGAGSVVSKDAPAFSIVAGNPARCIRLRFPKEIITILMGLRWWDWPIEHMRRHKALFEVNLCDISKEDLLRMLPTQK